MYFLTKLSRARWKIFGSRSWRTDQAQSILSYIHMTNLDTNLFEVLTGEGVPFFKLGRTVFSGLARANAYGPYTGLSSMVLQRKPSQGRTGHMITVDIILGMF